MDDGWRGRVRVARDGQGDRFATGRHFSPGMWPLYSIFLIMANLAPLWVFLFLSDDSRSSSSRSSSSPSLSAYRHRRLRPLPKFLAATIRPCSTTTTTLYEAVGFWRRGAGRRRSIPEHVSRQSEFVYRGTAEAGG